MDFGIIVIGIVITSLCIFPFIVISRKRNKQNGLLEKKLRTCASTKNYDPTQVEVIEHIAVGIDEQANGFFFHSTIREIEKSFCIDLTEFVRCKTIKSARTIKSKAGNHEVIDQLELAFYYKEKNRSPLYIEFFNSDTTMTLIGELQLIEKWEAIINKQLAKLRPLV